MSTLSKARSLRVVLVKFYRQPVAKVSTELFVSLAVVAFFAVFAIRPTLITIAELTSEIEAKEELAERLQSKVVALTTAQEAYQRFLPRIDLLDEAIPTQPRFTNALKIIEKIAGENNIIIRSASVTRIPDEEILENIDYDAVDQTDFILELSVMGDYPSIRDFVGELQSIRRSFIVEEMSFMVSEQTMQENLNADLVVKVPYFGTKDAEPI